MNIIFLDIDGVLNSEDYFIRTHQDKVNLCRKLDTSIDSERAKVQMMDIDLDKVLLLKEIVNKTDSKVVITSTWKRIKVYPYIAKSLIDLGIPIIGETKEDNLSCRGYGIKEFLNSHDVDNYIVIDDEKFEDYDSEIISKLVKTNFFKDGLQSIHVKEAVKLLKKE